MSQNLIQLRRKKGSVSPEHGPIERLRHVMHERREITAEDVAEIARATGAPEATVFGVATFYGDLGTKKRGRARVKVCRGTACFAAAGERHVGYLEEALGTKLDTTTEDGDVSLEGVYCLGFCNDGPCVEAEGEVYGRVTPEVAQDIAKNAKAKRFSGTAEQESVPRFEVMGGPAIVLERLASGIDACDLAKAREHGVYAGLTKALASEGGMRPEDVLEEVTLSQLRGRGGAGFPTATKWRLMAEHSRREGEGFIVCNADEGDPGSYIDKYLMERDPFAVLEGITLAGYATHATRGYVYVRSEYPRSAPALRAAVAKAKEAGLLGERILGSSFSFDIEICEGAGSYVCGEETALLRSLEGLRGMVTARPPFPAEKGLFGKPSIVNNVETLANVGFIVRHGGAHYASFGHGKSRGTKVLSLNERFARPGMVEVPFGVILREVLEGWAGGMKGGRPIKGVQVGGPLGGILPASLLDTKIGFDELDAVGGLLGHGGIVAFDDTTPMRDLAVHLFEFCDAESCGKCFPCRLGGRRGLELSRRLRDTHDPAEARAIVDLFPDLLETMKLGSLCAHGGAIPIPIASLLTHFRDEMLGGAS